MEKTKCPACDKNITAIHTLVKDLPLLCKKHRKELDDEFLNIIV